MEGLDDESRQRMLFGVRSFVDAMSPSNFALTNPQVLKRTMETRGENLLKGLANMLNDIAAGQLTQTKAGVFEVGKNLAMTPGKVIKETPLYQLIQYTPTTDKVLETPVVIFPPWINRFYILDLTPEKSFVKWCVDHGVTLFMVSWKSADESIADLTLEDYVMKGQIDAIDTVRDLLGVDGVHTIGYCVAGTTLAATLGYLHAGKRQATVKSATFLTAQVDFTQAGDLKLFTGDETMALLEEITRDKGYLDGRYMAATFNLLRGRDLIWNYVVNNYLLGEEPAPFDLLHWNSDTTNLPAKWHRDYLEDLYKGNKLIENGGISVADTPVDISKVKTPTYVQAGREDHIAPPESVWKIMDHFAGPKRFLLAGSGHIAGVVNPPAAQKYQYWVNDHPAETLESFIEGARSTRAAGGPTGSNGPGSRRRRPSKRRARGSRAKASSRRWRMRLDVTSRLAKLPVWTRLARPNERLDLEELQHRASRALPEYREQLDAYPEAIDLPLEQIERGQVVVAEGVDGIAGFAVIVIDQNSAELDGVFVEPELWLRGVRLDTRREGRA